MIYKKSNSSEIILNGVPYGRRLAFISRVLFLLLTGSTVVNGQVISITPRFDTTSIWIGEQTNFTISLEQPADMFVEFPPLYDTLSAHIEILSASPPDTVQAGDGRLKITKSYRVTSFDRGEHFAGELPFVFFTGDDRRVLSTRRIRLEVLAPETDQDAGIYDIKSPLGVPLGVMEILPWAVLLMVAGFLAWFMIRYYRRRKQAAPAPGLRETSEPAHVIALRELKQLKSASLWQQGKVKEYYTKLTEIIRIYIERRFGILAMERTSDEIIGELKGRSGMKGDVIGLLGDCLTLADLVKFAKGSPGPENHEASLNTAFHFVKATFDPDLPEPVEGSGNDGVRKVKTREEAERV